MTGFLSNVLITLADIEAENVSVSDMWNPRTLG